MPEEPTRDRTCDGPERERSSSTPRRGRSFLAIHALLLISVIVAITFVALWEGLRAEHAAKKAALAAREDALRRSDGLRLATQSSLVLQDDPSLALLLAIEAASKWTGPVVNDALAAAIARSHELGCLRGTPSTLVTPAFDATGTRAALVIEDRAVSVVDVETQTQTARCTGHDRPINHIAFNPDGTRLVTVSDDQTARIWDAERGFLLATMEGHVNALGHAVFSGDGRLLATATKLDGSYTLKQGENVAAPVRIWDVDSGSQRAALIDLVPPIHALAFSPDGAWLATAGGDGTVRLWDTDSGAAGPTFQGHTQPVRALEFDGRGRRLLSASDDDTVRVWQLDGSRAPVILRHRGDGPILHATFNPAGRYIATCAGDVHVWNVAGNGWRVARLTAHDRPVRHAAFSRDGTRLVTASSDRTVRIWNPYDGRAIAVLSGHQGEVQRAAFVGDASRVVSAGSDQTVRAWRARHTRGAPVLPTGPWSPVFSLPAPDGRGAITSTAAGTSDIWDLTDGVRSSVLQEGSGFPITTARYSPGGDQLIIARTDGSAEIWDAKPPKMTSRVRAAPAGVTCGSLGPRGRRLATGHRGGSVVVQDVVTGVQLARFERHQGRVSAIAWAPGRRVVASGGLDGTVRLWDVEDATRNTVLGGHESPVTAVDVSPDGRLLASGALDGSLRLWDVDARELFAILAGHRGQLNSVAFTSDSARLVSVGVDGFLRTWSAHNGSMDGEVTHGSAIRSLDLSTDGRRAVTGGEDGCVRVFNLAEHEPFVTFRGHDGPVRAVTFAAGGHHVMSHSFDGTARLWPLDLLDVARSLQGRSFTARELERFSIAR